MAEKAKSKYLLESVNNALKVLDILGIRDNIGVSEISRLSGSTKVAFSKYCIRWSTGTISIKQRMPSIASVQSWRILAIWPLGRKMW